MEMERRCRNNTELNITKKPEWLDFLPPMEDQISMEYVPYIDHPKEQYHIRIKKPAVISGDIETIEEITISEDDIKEARDWLTNAYSNIIDQHDDEGHSLRLPSIKDFVKDVDSSRTKFSIVFSFVEKNLHAELELQRQLKP